MHRIAVMLATAACFAASTAPRARAAEPRPVNGLFRVGPFELAPRFVVKNAGFDTNVFQTRNHPVRDAVVILSPQLDGSLRVGRRFRASGQGFLDINYFRREGDERSTDFYAGGDAMLSLGRLTLYGGGGGGQFTQRFSIDVDERLPRQEERAQAGALLRVGSRLSFGVRGSTEVVTFAPATFRLGGTVKEAMDRHTLIGGGELRYALTNRTTAVVWGEALEDRFFSQRGPTPRTRRSYRGLGGFEVRESTLRRTPSGRLLAGVRQFPGTLAQGSPPYRGPVVMADVALPLGRLGLLRTFAERDVRFASSLVDIGTLRYRNAFVYERLHADHQFGLPARVVGSVSGGFEQARYLLPYPYVSRTFLARRVDHRWTGRLAIARRFGDSMRLGGHVVWVRRVSSLPLFGYEAMTCGFTAEVTP